MKMILKPFVVATLVGCAAALRVPLTSPTRRALGPLTSPSRRAVSSAAGVAMGRAIFTNVIYPALPFAVAQPANADLTIEEIAARSNAEAEAAAEAKAVAEAKGPGIGAMAKDAGVVVAFLGLLGLFAKQVCHARRAPRALCVTCCCACVHA